MRKPDGQRLLIELNPLLRCTQQSGRAIDYWYEDDQADADVTASPVGCHLHQLDRYRV